jgi:hypothetical protein
MVRRKVADEYRRMTLEDQSTFRRWLVANTVVGVALFALIAIGSIFSNRESRSVTAQQGEDALFGNGSRVSLQVLNRHSYSGLKVGFSQER